GREDGCASSRAEGVTGKQVQSSKLKAPIISRHREAPLLSRTDARPDVPVVGLGHCDLAGRQTYDTRDEFCVAICSLSAGVILPRPAHTKTSCVGFRETQRPHVRAEVGGKGKSSAHQLFDLSLSAGNMATRDILVHRVVSEERVNPLR